MSKKFFGSITIHEKYGSTPENGDFRSFVSCSIDGEEWELRGYGASAAEAAQDAWAKYQEDDYWHIFGHITNAATN